LAWKDNSFVQLWPEGEKVMFIS